jgi:trans-2,3-dihydro-3-hydroxyanthranilate isomerase
MEASGIKFFITDVFAQHQYCGNQLAVFFDFGVLSSHEMQLIAHELNFSETTFITSSKLSKNGYDVRIFTPTNEISFAGHPTLGTAYVILNHLEKSENTGVSLNFKVGQIRVDVDGDYLWMMQNLPHFGKQLSPTLLSDVIKTPKELIDNRYPIEEVSTGLPFTIVPLKSMQALKAAEINILKYNEFVELTPAKGILLFCNDSYEENEDIAVRVFVNYLGIPEDAATGSAAGCLAAWLIKNNYFGESAIKKTIGQGYEINRPSQIRIDAEIVNNQYVIKVGGKVVEVAQGLWNKRIKNK